MQLGFRGESVHKVDAKGRVSIPASFRRVLEAGDPDRNPGEQANLVLIYGRTDFPRLECFTMAEMAIIDSLVQEFPPFSEEREELEYFLHTQSSYLQIDESGRIVLAQKLRDAIQIDEEAIFAGFGQSFHIWEPKNFETFVADMKKRRAVEGRPDVFARLSEVRRRTGASA